MQTVNLTQGTPEWVDFRSKHFPASDAPAVLGESPYKSRSELVKQYATGITPDVDPATQRRFDDGHRFEALARPLAEKIIGEELYPVTGVLDGTRFSASFDGLTILEDTAFEHKALNNSLRYTPWDEGNGWHLPKRYQIQLEQQLLVSGAERVLFMASKWADDGTLLEERHCWYTPDPELRQRIIAGWAQFETDVQAYRANPPAETVKVQAEVVESLPAVAVQLNGTLAVVSNLDKFGTALRTFVERIPAKPATDQEFANAEAACKTLKQAEDALDAAEAGALAQISDVELLRRTVADLKNVARTARMTTEKLVKAEKENRKTQIVTDAQKTLANHIAKINAALAKPAQIPMSLGNFGEAIKGLKSFDSMQDKVAGQLATEIAAAENTALKLSNNRAHLLDKDGKDWIFLFADFNAVGTKDAEDFQAVAELRISQHRRAEADRIEAERERIRQEEATKLRREQERQEIEAEKARREQAEAQAKAEQEAQALAFDQSNSEEERIRHSWPQCESTDAPADVAIQTTGFIAPAAPIEQDTAIEPEEAADVPCIKLGQINALLDPLSVTGDGLTRLGFSHVYQDKAAKLYRECDLPAILIAMERHLRAVRERIAEPVTA